jgi:hypothetical protein
MAARTRRSTGSPRSGSRRSTPPKNRLAGFRVPPHVARSLLGLVILVLGALTLIALIFPLEGVFNRYVQDILRPLVGQGAWLLAALLIVAGVLIERPSSIGHGSSLAIVGGVIVFAAGLGLIHLVWGNGGSRPALGDGGGALGYGLSSLLSDLLSPIGAFVVLVALLAAGMLLLFKRDAAGAAPPGDGWRSAARHGHRHTGQGNRRQRGQQARSRVNGDTLRGRVAQRQASALRPVGPHQGRVAAHRGAADASAVLGAAQPDNVERPHGAGCRTRSRERACHRRGTTLDR